MTITAAGSHSPVFRADASRHKAVAEVDNNVEFFVAQGFDEAQPTSPPGVFTSVVVNVNGIDLRFSGEECRRPRSDEESDVGIREVSPQGRDNGSGEHCIADEGEAEDEDFHLIPIVCECLQGWQHQEREDSPTGKTLRTVARGPVPRDR